MKTKILTQKRQEAPWLTARIIGCIRKKHDWHRLFKAKLITARSYNSYCSTLRFVLNLAEKEYYIRKFNGLGNDPKKNWKTLNYLLNNKRKSISNDFRIDGVTQTIRL